MGLPADEIISAALELPREVRAIMAERLIESLEFDGPLELSAEWRKELARRCKEIDAGTVELEDADKVFAKLYAELD